MDARGGWRWRGAAARIFLLLSCEMRTVFFFSVRETRAKRKLRKAREVKKKEVEREREEGRPTARRRGGAACTGSVLRRGEEGCQRAWWELEGQMVVGKPADAKDESGFTSFLCWQRTEGEEVPKEARYVLQKERAIRCPVHASPSPCPSLVLSHFMRHMREETACPSPGPE